MAINLGQAVAPLTLFGIHTKEARVKDGYFSVLILSESFILSHNSLIWALFVCALARLTANELEAKVFKDRLCHG